MKHYSTKINKPCLKGYFLILSEPGKSNYVHNIGDYHFFLPGVKRLNTEGCRGALPHLLLDLFYFLNPILLTLKNQS